MRSRALAALAVLALAFALPKSLVADDPKETPADAMAIVNELLDALDKGDFDAATARFDATMKKGLPKEKLAATWKPLGKLKKRGAPRTTETHGITVVVLTCEFEAMPFDVKVSVNLPKKEICGLFLTLPEMPYEPPAYARRESFDEEEVKVGEGKWVLGGTLSLPKGDGPFPGVVLVHGSGPNDRDETILGNKPFKDLAWGLASRGVAVLRYEKRTRAHGNELAAIADTFTVEEETVADALLAIELLRKHARISKVFVVGHSLGGLLAPRIATRDKKLAGIVVLAAPTRPLEDVVLGQLEFFDKIKPAPTGTKEEIDEELADRKAELEKERKKAARVRDPNLSKETKATDLPLAGTATYWLSIRDEKPAEIAHALSTPILVCQGDKDYQVTVEDFEGWQKTFADRKDAELKLYPGLYHLFMPGKMTPDDYKKVGHVDLTVIEDVAKFVTGH